MFCKTKKKAVELFSLSSPERRRAFRVSPTASSPIELTIRGKTVRVLDISAGGLSIEGPALAPGDRETVVFSLPDLKTEIRTTIEVVTVDAHRLAHCRFIDLDDNGKDAIHLYALQRQKEIIRSTKAPKGRPHEPEP